MATVAHQRVISQMQQTHELWKWTFWATAQALII